MLLYIALFLTGAGVGITLMALLTMSATESREEELRAAWRTIALLRDRIADLEFKLENRKGRK